MRRLAKTALGIDLGEGRLSVALVDKGPQGFRTLATASEDLSLSDPGQSPGKVLSRLLAQLGKRTYLGARQAAVAVSQGPLVMQLLDWPKPLPTNIGAFVAKELQQYVALSGKTLVSDFCGIGTGVQKRLLVVAGDSDPIQEMVNVCHAAGIAVDRVEPAALAYARAYGERKKAAPREDNVLIAMLEARTLTITLLRRGTLEFVRARDLPADTNTPRLLCTWLAEELKAVVRYYDAQVTRTDRAWRIQVVLHDRRHRVDEIAPLLAAEAATRSFLVVDACEPGPDPASAKEDLPGPRASRVAEGAALALLGVEGDDLRINLLPPAVTEARSFSRHLLLTANLCVLVFLGTFIAAQLLTRTGHALDRRIEQSRLSGELYVTPALIEEEKFLDEEIARLRQRVDPLRKVMNGRCAADWPEILQAVRQAVPAEVSVAQVRSADGRTLSVKGITASCPAAAVFVRNLEGRAPFAAVALATIQRQQEGGRFEYRIDCLLKAKGGPSS